MSGTKQWRIHVYVSATDDDPNPEGTTVDFTITSDHLLEAPRIGGQRVQPLAGKAESLSWSAQVGDFSEFFTGNMTDGQGRMNVAGRLVRVQRNVNAGGWSTVWTGRLTGAYETEGPGKYSVSFADERWRGHNLSIYDTADTAQVLPGGVKSKWKEMPAAGSASAVVGATTANDVLLTVLDKNIISSTVLKLLQKDLKENAKPGVSDGTTGNFNRLRCIVGGTQKEVISFGLIDRDPLVSLERQEDEEDHIKVITVWLAWGSGQPNVGDEFDDFVLTLDDTDTSDDWPYHIGGASGVDPIVEIRDRYDDFGMRYDSDVFSAWDASTNPDGLVDHPLIPRLFFRIRESQNLLPWTDDLYAFLGLVPFVNDDGEIAPKFAFQQHDVDPLTLPEVTDDDLADAATFDYSGTEAITVVRPRYSVSRQLKVQGITAFPNDARLVDDWPADLISTQDVPVPEYTHDNVDDVGRRVHTLNAVGAEFRGTSLAKRFFRQQATEIFDRFGDGPIYGNIVGLAAVESLKPGDWFRLTASNYPVFTTGARDGTTLVAQVLETRQDPEGPTIRFLTGGPDDQPLSAPSVSLAQDASRPKHDIEATISGLPAAADKYQLQIREGSGAWYTVAEGTANETVPIRNLPSGTEIDARVRATALNTIRSAWSATSSVTTDSLTAPSSPSASADGVGIVFTWTLGETDYGLMVTLDGTDYLESPLNPGTRSFEFANLDASTGYTVGVKHVDPYGGESALVTDTTTTGASPNQLDEPEQPHILQGAESSGADFGWNPAGGPAGSIPPDLGFGSGIEVGFTPTEDGASTIIQYDTDSSFSDPETTVAPPGASQVRVDIPITREPNVSFGDLYYFRFRHERAGFDPSPWTGTYTFHAGLGDEWTVNARAWPFQAVTPPVAEITNLSAVLIPTVSGGVRGFNVEVRFGLTHNAPRNSVVYYYSYNDGTNDVSNAGFMNPGSDVDGISFQLGGQFFEEDWTDIQVVLVVESANGKYGIPRKISVETGTTTGSGTRAALSAGGTAMADYVVAGSNITIDTDGDGRPQINAVAGAGANLDDLGDVTIDTPADDEVLAYDDATATWINQTAAEAGLAEAGHVHDAADITTGTFADALIAESNVTQHEAALSLLGIEGLVDPGDDRILFWDDSEGAFRFLDIGTGLTITATQLDVTGGFLETASTGLVASGTDVQVSYDASVAATVIASAIDGLGVGTLDGSDRILFADFDDDLDVKFADINQMPFLQSGDAVETVTAVANAGISVGGTATDVTLDLEIVDLSLTTTSPVANDSIPFHLDGGDSRRILIQNIDVGEFNNDVGYLTSVDAADISPGTFVSGTWTFAANGDVRLGDDTELQAWDRDATSPAYVDVIAVPTANDLRIGNDAWIDLDIRAQNVMVNGSTIIEDIVAGAGLAGSGTSTVTLSVNAADGVRVTSDNVQLDVGGLTNSGPESLDSLVYWDDSASNHKRIVIEQFDVTLMDTTGLATGYDTAGDGLTDGGSATTISVDYGDNAANVVTAAPDFSGSLQAGDTFLFDDLSGGGAKEIQFADIENSLSIGANQITPGTFGSGDYTFPALVNINNSGANGFRVRRSSSNGEAMLVSLEDAITNLHYTNDESGARFRLRIENTDTESGGGASANNEFVDIIGDTAGIRIQPSTLGNQTNPTYGWQDDPDTGMYLPTTGTLGFTAAGIRRLDLDSIDATHGRFRFDNGQVHTVEGAEITRGSAGSVTLDWDAYNSVDLRNDGNINTINIDDGSMQDGNPYTLVVRMATGGQASITFNATGTLQWQEGSAPTFPLTVGDRTLITFFKTGGITLGFYADAPT